MNNLQWSPQLVWGLLKKLEYAASEKSWSKTMTTNTCIFIEICILNSKQNTLDVL